jgi:PKD repeat protein
MMAVVTGTLVLASACSDGTGTPPPDNTGPTADFDLPPCTINVPCNFASKSTDDVAVTDWSWDFDGDDHPDANTATASFRYETAADFSVSLTVHDAQGLSSTKTRTLTVAPGNTPPTASFTYSCTRADCTFTSTSTDVAPGTIATYAWTFGDGATADVSNPLHTYAATVPTDFTVTLTVTDNEGATDVETQTVTITPINTPPTAGFTYTCNAASCRFTSTSTDLAPGTITTYAWTFGDLGTANVMNPLHAYAITVPTDFTVTLTVTDNEGATDVETQTVSVSPPVVGAEGCFNKTIGNPARAVVDCAFNVTAKSTMKVKLLAINCDIEGQRVVAPPPIGDQMFLAVCERTAGEEIGIFGGPLDKLIVYEAGSQVVIRFFQGFADRRHPVLEPPSATFEGTFPDWTMHFEDGSEPGEPGEPDFADVVVGLHATVIP